MLISRLRRLMTRLLSITLPLPFAEPLAGGEEDAPHGAADG